MNFNYKQSQFELFPTVAGGSQKIGKPQLLFSSLTLSLENIIIISIFILMTIVFSFSAGVEKGKKLIFVTPAAIPADLALPRRDDPLPQKPTATANPSKVVFPQKPAEENKIEKPAGAPKQQEILDSPYTIQVASFAKDEYAQKEAATLQKKGFEIFVVSKGKYSIVCVGKFSHKDDAKVILTRLQKTYKDCLVRRL